MIQNVYRPFKRGKLINILGRLAIPLLSESVLFHNTLSRAMAGLILADKWGWQCRVFAEHPSTSNDGIIAHSARHRATSDFARLNEFPTYKYVIGSFYSSLDIREMKPNGLLAFWKIGLWLCAFRLCFSIAIQKSYYPTLILLILHLWMFVRMYIHYHNLSE